MTRSSRLRLQRRIVAHQAVGDRAPLGQRVESERLQHREGRPLRHALGQPLLGLPFAPGQLDLRHVRQLVGDEPQPVARGRRAALVVQQQLPALADADGELAELGGRPDRSQPTVSDQAPLEDGARRVHVDRHLLGYRQPQIAGRSIVATPRTTASCVEKSLG